MSEKEKKEIAEMVETAKHLATHDPQAFMIAKHRCVNSGIARCKSNDERKLSVRKRKN